MSQQEILMLAKQGNPQAIAVILNQLTRPLGVNAKVAQQSDVFHILLEAIPVPDQQIMVAMIQAELLKLQITSPNSAKLYGRQTGEKSAAWSYKISLEPSRPEVFHPVSEVGLRDTVEPSPETDAVIDLNSNEEQPGLELWPQNSIASASEIQIVVSQGQVAVSAVQEKGELTRELLKRPEAIVLLTLAVFLIFWEAFVLLLQESERSFETISGRKLARRLKVSSSTISRKKAMADFSAWTQSLDPEEIAWVYQENGQFAPLGAGLQTSDATAS